MALIISHRHHQLPLGSSYLALDRAISPTFMVRHVTIRELVQDERLTQMLLGVDCEHERRRVAIVLRGSLYDFVDQRSSPLTAGEALFVPEGATYACRAVDCDLLELEWDPGTLDDGAPHPRERLRLGTLARASARELAERLARATDDAELQQPLLELLRALGAEGHRFVVDAGWARDKASLSDQLLMDRIDGALSELHESPMLVDLERSLGTTRRTLARKIRGLHERYALLGRGHGRWRGIRDRYRLVVASILVSHRDATPRSVAGLVGYGSIEALDHAFRHASLPSPVALRRAVLSF